MTEPFEPEEDRTAIAEEAARRMLAAVEITDAEAQAMMRVLGPDEARVCSPRPS